MLLVQMLDHIPVWCVLGGLPASLNRCCAALAPIQQQVSSSSTSRVASTATHQHPNTLNDQDAAAAASEAGAAQSAALEQQPRPAAAALPALGLQWITGPSSHARAFSSSCGVLQQPQRLWQVQQQVKQQHYFQLWQQQSVHQQCIERLCLPAVPPLQQLLQQPLPQQLPGVRLAHSRPYNKPNRQAGASSSSSTRGPPGSPAAPQPPRPAAAPGRQRPRSNREITAAQLMVVFPDGSRQVLSLSDALAAAEAAGLDLVEVAPQADPPVARILDLKRLLYEQQKKADEMEKQRRYQQKLATPKEMQFTARIADHDLEVKMRRVAEWLEQGHRVQLVVKHRTTEQQAAAEALSYLTSRVQAEFKVVVGEQQEQRRAVSVLVKPTTGSKH